MMCHAGVHSVVGMAKSKGERVLPCRDDVFSERLLRMPWVIAVVGRNIGPVSPLRR
ncbi:hypothetical protein LMG33810_000473 [Carnimonas sp. LMG 33810]